jgi:hypothetical protein
VTAAYWFGELAPRFATPSLGKGGLLLPTPAKPPVGFGGACGFRNPFATAITTLKQPAEMRGFSLVEIPPCPALKLKGLG